MGGLPSLSFASGPADSGHSQSQGGAGYTGDFHVGSRSSNAQLVIVGLVLAVGVYLWRR